MSVVEVVGGGVLVVVEDRLAERGARAGEGSGVEARSTNTGAPIEEAFVSESGLKGPKDVALLSAVEASGTAPVAKRP